MSHIHAWTAQAPKEPLILGKYEPTPLGADEVEIAVEYCGLCHSDLSLLNNDWGISQYPYVPGHEVIGRILALGEHTRGLEVGQRVGVGWNSESCLHCHQCISGNHQLCTEAHLTIVGRPGGFAERIRVQWAWVFPLPSELDITSAGPLLCGGVTVFTPFILNNIKPTDHVGILGMGGLGHLATKFAKAWGSEVTVFTHTLSKQADAKSFGADHIVSSVDSQAIRTLPRKLDMLLVTANVGLDWSALMSTIAPKGGIHFVGVVPEPIQVAAFDLIGAQRSVSGSPSGSPSMIATMLDFAARHHIAPQVEHFPMSRINEAFQRLASGNARYRIVLDADFAAN